MVLRQRGCRKQFSRNMNGGRKRRQWDAQTRSQKTLASSREPEPRLRVSLASHQTSAPSLLKLEFTKLGKTSHTQCHWKSMFWELSPPRAAWKTSPRH